MIEVSWWPLRQLSPVASRDESLRVHCCGLVVVGRHAAVGIVSPVSVRDDFGADRPVSFLALSRWPWFDLVGHRCVSFLFCGLRCCSGRFDLNVVSGVFGACLCTAGVVNLGVALGHLAVQAPCSSVVLFFKPVSLSLHCGDVLDHGACILLVQACFRHSRDHINDLLHRQLACDAFLGVRVLGHRLQRQGSQ